MWHRAIVGVLLGASVIGVTAQARAQLVAVPIVLVDGETVEQVAARFDVSLDNLQALNDDTDLRALHPGDALIVGYGERVEHRVARGETLLRIARHYGVSAADLARWNAMEDPRRIRADAMLLVYGWPSLPLSSSIGRPSAGALENGIRLRSNERWEVHDPGHAYVTRDAASALDRGIQAVAAHWPGSPRIEIRDASSEHGGPLRGHHSHQSGRDVDIAYFRHGCGPTCSHHRVTPNALDAERQWAVLEVWLREASVEYVFIDYELQEPLYRAAQASGASPSDLARWFQWPADSDRRVGIIRHASGHRDHLHVRFGCADHDPACGPQRGSDEPP